MEGKKIIWIGIALAALAGIVALIALMPVPELPTQPLSRFEKLEQELVVNNLKAGDYVKPPLFIAGEAAESWYREGKFVIEVKDSEGELVGSGVAELRGGAYGGVAPFEATVDFIMPSEGSEGTITFVKPSTSPGAGDGFKISKSVVFSTTPAPVEEEDGE